jgi:hypothetical protein
VRPLKGPLGMELGMILESSSPSSAARAVGLKNLGPPVLLGSA